MDLELFKGTPGLSVMPHQRPLLPSYKLQLYSLIVTLHILPMTQSPIMQLTQA